MKGECLWEKIMRSWEMKLLPDWEENKILPSCFTVLQDFVFSLQICLRQNWKESRSCRMSWA